MERTKVVEIEDTKYTIKRLTAKEAIEIGNVPDENTSEANLKTVELGLVDPKFNRQQIEALDSVHYYFLVYQINSFNSLAPFLQPSKPTSTETPPPSSTPQKQTP